MGLLGWAAILLIAFLLSEDRRRIPWRTVIGGVALQVALGLLLLGVPATRRAMLLVNQAALALQGATDTGSAFVFGYLGGGPLPFTENHPGASFVLAFKVLPLVLTISALAALLFHWGILQRVTAALAWVLRRVLGVGGALALGAAAHIFLGMIEAPLLVRPYLARMQRGELFALMTCGMAGVAGTVMVIYAAFLAPVVPDALGHILIASVVSTPAALAIAAMMVPFAPNPEAEGRITLADPPLSAMDAVVKGTMDGIGPVVAIASVLLVTIALVTLVNGMLGHLPDWAGAPVTLQRLFAVPLRPILWTIGVPWAESGAAAGLMATKTVLNEFVAYLDLARLPEGTLSPQVRLIMIYAMCGFANFGSCGILIGGLSAMVPERRQEVVTLGVRSILSGTMATLTSGALAGLIG